MNMPRSAGMLDRSIKSGAWNMAARFGILVTATIVAVGAAGAALADPLGDLLLKGTGGVCFTRTYDQAHLDKHPAQKTTEVRLSLRKETDQGAVIRVMLKDRSKTSYIVGGCDWTAKANLDINDKPIIAAFKGPSGLNCWSLTSADGSSAEEGGDFPIDLKDGKSIYLYLPDSIAAWPSFDRSQFAGFIELGSEDQVFRLDKADAAPCDEMVEKLPWLL
jgi:hypothetical protein